MLSILSRIVHDPVQLYLLVGDVLATFAVGVGIISEHGPEDVQKVANRLVIWGVIAETLFSVALFAYDANFAGEQQEVIRSQNDKLIALETRLAPRHLDAGEKDEFIKRMKKLSGTKFALSTAESAEAEKLAEQQAAQPSNE